VGRGELNPWWRVGVALGYPLLRLLFRVEVRGLEHVPSSGPAVVAFNHVSMLDGPALGLVVGWGLRRESRFLVAAEFFAKGIYGWLLRRYDQIPIRRGEGDDEALDDAVATVHRGALVALAPEGRVDERGGLEGLQRLRSGIARIALPTGAPVVPVGIWGTQVRYPRRRFHFGVPFRPRLVIAFGPPMLASGSVEVAGDIDSFLLRLAEHLEAQVTEARRLAG